MDHQQPENTPRRYEETTHPDNPPNSVLSAPARRAAVWSYFVPIVVLFVVIGVALLYWANRPAHSAATTDRAEVGTTGSSQGGFDPQPRPGSTREEIERRGSDLTPVTSLKDLDDVETRSMVGRRVSLSDVRVESVQGNTFWVGSGAAKYPVIMETAPAIKAGAKVDLSGHLESDGPRGVRIIAEHVQAK